MQKIKVQTGADRWRSVDAIVVGNWAAHRSVNESGWSVTSAAYGRRVASDLDKQTAVRLATRLQDRVPDLRWSGKDDEYPHADDLAAVLSVLAESRQ